MVFRRRSQGWRRDIDEIPGSVRKPTITRRVRPIGEARIIYVDRENDFWQYNQDVDEMRILGPDGRPILNTPLTKSEADANFGPLRIAFESDVQWRYLDFIDSRLSDENI